MAARSRLLSLNSMNVRSRDVCTQMFLQQLCLGSLLHQPHQKKQVA